MDEQAATTLRASVWNHQSNDGLPALPASRTGQGPCRTGTLRPLLQSQAGGDHTRCTQSPASAPSTGSMMAQKIITGCATGHFLPGLLRFGAASPAKTAAAEQNLMSNKANPMTLTF